MRAVVQRVTNASVRVNGAVIGEVGLGLLILLAVAPGDSRAEALWMARKIAGLRIFADDEGLMNRGLVEVGGGALVVSQFTLYGDCRKGRRPSFQRSAAPDVAEPLYELFCGLLREEGVPHVAQGMFGADMAVELLNDGPVTLIIDSP